MGEGGGRALAASLFAEEMFEMHNIYPWKDIQGSKNFRNIRANHISGEGKLM